MSAANESYDDKLQVIGSENSSFDEKLQVLNNENNALKEQIKALNNENKTLNEQVQSLTIENNNNNTTRADVRKLEKAILAVQETSDRIKGTGIEYNKGYFIDVEEAKNNANSIVHEALVNAEKTEHERLLLEKNTKVYKEKIRAILESQLSLIEELDSIELDNYD